MRAIINIGAAANDGTGDAVRTAFDKCNLNFDELFNYNWQIVAMGMVQLTAGAASFSVPGLIDDGTYQSFLTRAALSGTAGHLIAQQDDDVVVIGSTSALDTSFVRVLVVKFTALV